MAKRYKPGDLSEQELLDKLLRYCDYQERCKMDIYKKANLLGVVEDEVPTYISKLEELGYLNEERFVRSFVRGKVNLKKWGIQRIKRELQFRDIPEELYSEYLGDIDQEQYREQFTAIAKSKWEKIKGKTLYEKKAKLFKFLYSKGYESEMIKAFLNRL